MLWGVIFDFDGVIVHSEKEHEKCWFEVAKRKNLPITQKAFLDGFGLKNERFIKEILRWKVDENEIRSIISQKEALFQEIVAKQGIELIPGTKEFLSLLKHHKIPCAIGSSSIRKNIDIVLEKTSLADFFQAIISGEDVKQGKPHPEVFLLCAQKLHLPPSQTIVIEDAPLGIEAAKKAGSKTVALTSTFPKEAFFREGFLPDRIVSSLNQLELSDLDSFFQRS